VTLSQAADGGSTFSGWSGACTGTGVCQVTMNAAAAVTATFAAVPSSLSINDVTLNEGNSGTTNATFTVTLSPASSQTVTVNYATANGTATAGSDYVAQSGTLTFTAGQTTKTISVTVNGDTTVEPNETFVVNLMSPSGATLADSQGQGTIVNDDTAPLPSLSINDVTVTEGDSGTKAATFTVTLSAASTSAVTVTFATANGTATAGSDYVAQSGTLTFTAGQTTRTISVTVNGDTTVEPNETFVVNLMTPSGATLADSQGQGTIRNDDTSPSPEETEAVAWRNLVGASVSGTNDLVKTAPQARWGNSGASSTRQIFGYGYVEFAVPAGNAEQAVFGLNDGDTNQSFREIDYAFYTYRGRVLIFERGRYVGGFVPYTAGDKLRISVNAGLVRYWQNGALLHSSSLPALTALRVDTSLKDPSVTIKEAVLGGNLSDVRATDGAPVVWTKLVGALVYAANDLVKTAPQAWWGNSGASSTRQIIGDGYVEFTVPAGNAEGAVFGLNDGDMNQSFREIDYAFYTYRGRVLIFERGRYVGGFVPYTAGDKLRISANAGLVRYWQNGALLHTSSLRALTALRVDTSLKDPSVTIKEAILGGDLSDVADVGSGAAGR